MRHEESKIQRAAIKILDDYFRTSLCELIVNGHAPIMAASNEGKRSIVTGSLMKQQGLRKGFPDLFLHLKRKGYGGLCIEVKTEKGRFTKEQIAYLAHLKEQGYKVEICRTVQQIVDAVLAYI